jgi:single-strand DNA-binding protein
MNLVVLKGNIGKDPEVRQFEWGKAAKFSLATSESYTDKKGERITETEWHNIVFRGPVCDVIEKHLHKGDQVVVTGKIKSRSYENKDKQTIYITEIICDHFEFCSSPARENKPATNEGKYQKSGKVEAVSMSNANDLPGYVNSGEVPDDMSDLPF